MMTIWVMCMLKVKVMRLRIGRSYIMEDWEMGSLFLRFLHSIVAPYFCRKCFLRFCFPTLTAGLGLGSG